MIHSFFAILPIFLLIVLGYITKKIFIKNEEFWVCSDKLVYYIFFPSLLILKLSSANFEATKSFIGLLIATVSTGLVALIIFVYKWSFVPSNKLFTSVFQGAIRYNSYIFIALSESLFGTSGIAISAIYIAFMIILTNIFSIIVMNKYGTSSKKSVITIVQKTLTNPLIIGALIGVLINVFNISFSQKEIFHFMSYLSSAATPLSLMSVGAGLLFILDKKKIMAISCSIIAKLLILPILAFILIDLLDINGLVASVTLLYCAVPCAGNAYILSRQMGGDSTAMAAIITWGTLLSVLTIPPIMSMV